jgi:hypothetical protein
VLNLTSWQAKQLPAFTPASLNTRLVTALAINHDDRILYGALGSPVAIYAMDLISGLKT